MLHLVARARRIPVEVEHAVLAAFPDRKAEIFSTVGTGGRLDDRDRADLARAVAARDPDRADEILERMEAEVPPPAVWLERGSGPLLESPSPRGDAATRDRLLRNAVVESPAGWRAEASADHPTSILVRDRSGALLQRLEIEAPPFPHDDFEITLLAATRERLVTVDSGGEDAPSLGGFYSQPAGFARLRIWTIGAPDALVMAEPVPFADTFAGALAVSPDGELAALGAKHAPETWIVRLADAALIAVVPASAERLAFPAPRALAVQRDAESRLFGPP